MMPAVTNTEAANQEMKIVQPRLSGGDSRDCSEGDEQVPCCRPPRSNPVSYRTSETWLDNFISWFAASVLVTAGIIYGLKLHDYRHQRPHPPVLPPRATPAQEPLTLQELRAANAAAGAARARRCKFPGAGGKISSSAPIPNAGRPFLALAAGVVFYSLVALFPAIAAGVSSYALFADAATIGKQLSLAADIIPAGSLDLLRDEITRIAAKSDGKLTFGFLLGFGIALWSANAGMKAIFDALNIIYDEEEKRGLIWLNLVSLFFTLCAIGAVVLAIRGGRVSAGPRRLRAHRPRPSDHRLSALAGDVCADDRRAGGALSLRTEPAAREMALDQRRQRLRGARLARGVFAVLLVSRQFRQLQCHLRRARRGGRPDDVDVAFDHRRAGRRRAQFRDRAPDRPRLHGRPAKPLGARGAVMADTVGAGVP